MNIELNKYYEAHFGGAMYYFRLDEYNYNGISEYHHIHVSHCARYIGGDEWEYLGKYYFRAIYVNIAMMNKFPDEAVKIYRKNIANELLEQRKLKQ